MPTTIPSNIQISNLVAALNTNFASIPNQTHTVTIPIVGSPITTGTTCVGFPAMANFTSTITGCTILGNVSGSITVDIWKANAAIPSSANKISSTSPATLSSQQINSASSISGWTTSISPHDVFWASVATVDGTLTSVTIQILC